MPKYWLQSLKFSERDIFTGHKQKSFLNLKIIYPSLYFGQFAFSFFKGMTVIF